MNWEGKNSNKNKMKKGDENKQSKKQLGGSVEKGAQEKKDKFQ